MLQYEKKLAIVLLAAVIIGAASCKREQRSFRMPPAVAAFTENVPYQNRVRPGPAAPGTPSTSRPFDLDRVNREPYGRTFPKNAQALSDGQTLYESFNCVGCHAHGAGGIGPPLLDPNWFYGGDPQQVYLSILEGRPNGMPAFRGRIPDHQIWAIVAYVRSLSGLASPQAAPGREDHMTAQPPPNSMSGSQRPQTVPAPTTGPATFEVTPTGRRSATTRSSTSATTKPTTRTR